MDKIVFNDYIGLAHKMIETAESGGTAYAVCFFDDAVGILKELMSIDEVTVGSISITDEEYDGYTKEYYVSIDGDYIVDVQPAWHDKNDYHDAGYYGFEAEDVFIDGDANSAILKVIDNATCYEIEFDFSGYSIFDDIDFSGIDIMSLILNLLIGE